MELKLRHQDTGLIRLHLAEAGPEDGHPVFLLHGFPDFWYGWRKLMGPLVDAGFRVIVPDQRGYNLSSKPEHTEAYDLDELSQDIINLADVLGYPSFSVVGHDWGAMVGWWLASEHANRIDHFVSIGASHPAVWRRLLDDSLMQKIRSAHYKLLNIPELPEKLLAMRNHAIPSYLMRWAHRDSLSDEDYAWYHRAWSQPNALRGMINWHRALLFKDMGFLDNYRVPVPTLSIWGSKDALSIRQAASEGMKLCAHGKLVVIENAGHWVHHDQPDRVMKLVREFMTQGIRGQAQRSLT